MEKTCTKCQTDITLKETLQEHSNGTIHIRGACPICDSFIQWVPFSKSSLVHEQLEVSFNNRNGGNNELSVN